MNFSFSCQLVRHLALVNPVYFCVFHYSIPLIFALLFLLFLCHFKMMIYFGPFLICFRFLFLSHWINTNFISVIITVLYFSFLFITFLGGSCKIWLCKFFFWLFIKFWRISNKVKLCSILEFFETFCWRISVKITY